MGVMADRLAAKAYAPAHARAVDLLSRWMAAEQKRIFQLCYRLLQDPAEADSATQDVFLKAFRALSKENSDDLDDPRPWLTRVAVNTCLDRLRSQRWQIWRRRPAPEDESSILSMARSAEPDAEQRAMAAQIGVRLNRALAQLSPRQRAVFVLRHYEGRSLDEIAQILGLETGTVKAHLARALVKLREELKDLYGGRKARAPKEADPER